MTNDKAIKLLHSISDSQFDGIHGDERREALEMAVRALFSQQTVNDSQGLVNDCISRKQAIDGIKKEILKGDRRFYKGLLVANHVILHLPPAHPQRKTGKWKLVNYSDGCIDEVECDQCGDLEIYKSNYCPNCGARMDGESE